jgi:cytochrome P450
MKLSDIDIYNPENYVAQPPYEMFAYLREHAPIYKHPHPDGGDFWVISQHADVTAISRDFKRFSAERGFVLVDNLPADILAETKSQLLGMDPPNHTPIRRAVINRFTTRMVESMVPRIEGMIKEIFDAAMAKQEHDFVDDLCAELPTNVICDLMGIPRKDWAQIRHWADKQTSADDPDIVESPEESRQASIDMGTYGYQLAAERSKQDISPDEDLMMLLLSSEVNGAPVDPIQFASLFIQITVAGNETTRNLLAYGMLVLLNNPELYKRLAENPDLIPPAVEEMLRYICPLHYFRRTATSDVHMHDAHIREGDRVMMSYVSANRDKQVFKDADRFDLARDNNRSHMSFGHGIHLCLGAHLARLEARLFFETCFRRLSDIKLSGEPRRIRSNLINGLKGMPVQMHVSP